MADDDIYGNKARYERFLRDLDKRASGEKMSGKIVYSIKHASNVQYFHRLIPVFEARDLSFIHRLRQMADLLIAAHVVGKDFAEVDREDMDAIVAFMHTRYKSVKSKEDFIKHMRYLWKMLFPVKDDRGYIDDKAYPYPVKHLSSRIDRSKGRMRNDRLTWEDFQRVLDYFAFDRRMQAYIMLAMESLGRPQEILLRRIKHVELHDNYAKVWLTEHGKEGPGLLQCIDAYPYLVRWLEEHPLKGDPDAYLFVNTGRTNFGKGMSPYNVNKHLRRACKDLGIEKTVTAYSLKRNGVTFRRLRGDSDLEIQHAARWTSTEQLKTYDLSVQEDAMHVQLVKRGLLPGEKQENKYNTKKCIYCETFNGFSARTCVTCKRPLNRDKIKEERKRDEAVNKALWLVEEYSKKHPEFLEELQKLGAEQ